MGLKDAFRSLRGDRIAASGGLEEAAHSDVPEPMLFRPRYDGTYHGRDDAGAPQGFLRFSGGRVYFAPADTAAEVIETVLGRANPDPWSGDYTPAGRFTVQRRFERPVIHTVLEFGGDTFRARRTSTATNETSELTYTFVPYEATAGAPDPAG